MIVNGIDGCKSGWFIFSLNNNSYSFEIVNKLNDAIDLLNSADLNLIDIPLGLEENKHYRECDLHLKKLLGKKASSIFNAPIYAILDSVNYKTACEISYSITGKKISIQTWNIIPKIKDANNFLQNYKNKNLLKEFHPETGFLILNKFKPLSFSKKKSEGIKERLNILSAYINSHKIFNNILNKTLRKDVSRDDIVDAMCCAVNGRFAKKTFSVPEKSNKDKFEIPIEIILTEF